MELHQLRYLVAVVDDGSFTRAAARLHVSQPGISAQLKKLEHEVGEALLDRTGRRVVATAVGADVLRHAREALGAVEAIGRTVDEHAGLLTGRVDVGVVGSGTPPELPALLASFARAHPRVEITLSEGPGAVRLAAVLDGRSDLAIVGLVGDPPPGVEAMTLRDERVVVALATDHPLAARRRLSLAEVAAHPVIALPVGTGLRAGIDQALEAAGLDVRVAYEASTPMVLCELAAHGLGLALVPESVVGFASGVVAVPLVSPALRGRIELVWPAQRPVSPAGRALIALARDRFHGAA